MMRPDRCCKQKKKKKEGNPKAPVAISRELRTNQTCHTKSNSNGQLNNKSKQIKIDNKLGGKRKNDNHKPKNGSKKNFQP